MSSKASQLAAAKARSAANTAKKNPAPKASTPVKSSSNSAYSNDPFTQPASSYAAPNYGIPKASSNFSDTAFGQATAPNNAYSNSAMGQATSGSSKSSGSSSKSSSSSKSKSSGGSSSNNSSSNSSSTQIQPTAINTGRDLAATIYNNTVGIPTANASTGPKTIGTLSQGQAPGILDKLGNAAGAVGNYFQGTGIGDIWNEANNLLGNNKNTSNYTPEKPTGTGAGSATYYNNYIPKDTSGNIFADYNPAAGKSTNDQLGYSINSNNYSSGVDNLKNIIASNSKNNQSFSQPQATPHQVANPFSQFQNTPQITPDISKAMEQFGITPPPMVNYGNFDQTPQQSQNTGTQRQFLGNGFLSNGIANNGGGGYGVQGAMTGTGKQDNTSNPLDDLLTLLGIKPMTAKASTGEQMQQPQSPADMAMQSAPSLAPNAVQNALYAPQTNLGTANFGNTGNGGLPTLGGSTSQGLYGSNSLNLGNYGISNGSLQAASDQKAAQDKAMADINKQNMPAANGGVAQQYSQPQGQSNAVGVEQSMMKGYGAQEKAQKQALNALLDSIKNQYNTQNDSLNTTFQNQQNTLNQQYQTQQDTGTQALEKQKQADLQALAGQFNFQANQSPDSEQRIQYQQRAQDESNTQLKDLITKLSTAKGTDLTNLANAYNTDLTNLGLSKNKDLSSAQQNYQQALAAIADKRGTTQLEIAKMSDALVKDALDRASKGQGFTPAQQQGYVSAYSKDLQATLGKYSKLGAGQNGREQAAQELNQRWGNIFTPQSIISDVSQAAPNGWEGSYAKMYPGSSNGMTINQDGSITVN